MENDDDQPPENGTMEGVSSEDQTPVPAHRMRSQYHEMVVAMQNLSDSLREASRHMAEISRTIARVGASPEMRSAIGHELRELRDEIDSAAVIVDPAHQATP